MNARLHKRDSRLRGDRYALRGCFGKGGGAPAAPDPYATAAAQGAANKETAIAQGRINNPNITNPYGSQVVSWGEPDSTGVAQPTINQTLSPQGQERFDQEQRIAGQLGDVAEAGVSRVGAKMSQSFGMGGAPKPGYSVGQQNYAGNVATPDLANSYDTAGMVHSGTGYHQPIQQSLGNFGSPQSTFGDVGGPQNTFGASGKIQTGVDYSKASRLPTLNDFGADRARIEQALASRMEPQLQRDESAMRQRLANQGLTATHEAYGADVDALNRQKTDARMQTILAGAGEQSRLFNQAMQARQQGVGEINSQGQFANLAQQQGYNQSQGRGQFFNDAQQQGYNQALGRGQFANDAQQQTFAQGLAGANFGNTAQQQGYNQAHGNLAADNAAQAQQNAQNAQQAAFANTALQNEFGMGQQNADLQNQSAQLRSGEALTNANLQNQGRQQYLQENSFLRSMPLNEINALRSGSQVGIPQFQQYQGAQMAAPPVAQSIQNAYGQNLNSYNAQQAQQGSFNQGLMSLAGTGAMLAFSDRRLKSNVERVGTHPLGIGIYEYDIFGHRERGVMADEVLNVRPEAVVSNGDYLMVDYGQLHA